VGKEEKKEEEEITGLVHPSQWCTRWRQIQKCRRRQKINICKLEVFCFSVTNTETGHYHTHTHWTVSTSHSDSNYSKELMGIVTIITYFDHRSIQKSCKCSM